MVLQHRLYEVMPSSIPITNICDGGSWICWKIVGYAQWPIFHPIKSRFREPAQISTILWKKTHQLAEHSPSSDTRPKERTTLPGENPKALSAVSVCATLSSRISAASLIKELEVSVNAGHLDRRQQFYKRAPEYSASSIEPHALFQRPGGETRFLDPFNSRCKESSFAHKSQSATDQR